MHHDALIAHAVAVANAADAPAIERAWIASLASRDLRRRSVWPRQVFLQHLPEHPFTPSEVFSARRCAVCGVGAEADPVSADDLDGDAFWFRPLNVPWAAAAVEAFSGDDDPELVARGSAVLDALIERIRALPPSAQLTELGTSITGALASNKLERTVLLEALGTAGILRVEGHPSYADEFIAYDDAQSRMPPERNKQEWAYPIRFWSGADGISQNALKRLRSASAG